jgi:tetratricopeptide (TPR) repeat protein
MGSLAQKRPSKLLRDETLERLALDFEIGFFEKVLLHDPENLDALEVLGHAYTRAGRIEKGLEVDRKLVRMLPENALAHYNLACSLSLLGRIDEALESLERALALGYSDFDYLAQDPDLENVRRDGRYKALLFKKTS